MSASMIVMTPLTMAALLQKLIICIAKATARDIFRYACSMNLRNTFQKSFYRSLVNKSMILGHCLQRRMKSTTINVMINIRPSMTSMIPIFDKTFEWPLLSASTSPSDSDSLLPNPADTSPKSLSIFSVSHSYGINSPSAIFRNVLMAMTAFAGICACHSVKNTTNWSVLIMPQRSFREEPTRMLIAMLPVETAFAVF